MRQKFDGHPLNVRNVVPNYFEYCLQPTTTPDSACPLLYEFVIEPFALEEECRRGGRATSSDQRRMRPYSDAVAVASTTTTAVATTVTADPGELSCCSPRPLAIGVVAVTMSFALIYFLMIVPMASTVEPSTPTPPFSFSNISSISVFPKNTSDTNLTTSSPTTTTQDPLYPHINERLHRHQIPLIHTPNLYEVQLKLFVPFNKNISFGDDNFGVEGHVRVHFLSGGGSRILLHSDSEQHVGDCVVHDDIGREITVNHIGREYSNVLDIQLSADMITGMNYTLDVAFREKTRNQPFGMFVASYQDHAEKKYVVGTHLQVSEARTVFPCIDVPEAKAQFETVIIHPVGTTAIANMKENSSITEGNWTTTRFNPTPPMATYLFAFSVSDFTYLESVYSGRVQSRVYCNPEKIENARLLLNAISPLLKIYEDYFGIPYPLEKLDIVILPKLGVVAMENWGLITIREEEGLYSKDKYAITHKHNMLEVIAHELAHQWFGNLVTMKWWNDMWLNEGFASLISWRAVDILENTTWRYEHVTAESMCQVLRADQSPSMIPISSKKSENFLGVLENQPEAVKTIVYKKSAIVIRMIERLVDEDIFKQGLHLFLNSFLYKNADHEDLFNVLTYVHDSSAGGHLRGQNFSLSDVMDTWIRQNHFPLLHVNRKEGSIVTLRQEKYEHFRPGFEDPNNMVWKIPIFHEDPVTGKHKVFWVTDKQPTVFDMGGQLIVDPHQLTYMRLRYDMEMYSDITTALLEDYTKIATNSRSRLLDDTFAMAEYGQISYQIPLNMSVHMWKENSYRPFKTLSAYLDFYLPRLYAHDSWPVFREYLLLIFGPQFDRFQEEGFDVSLDDDNDKMRLREVIVFRACILGYEPCVKMSKEKFREARKNCSVEKPLSDNTCNDIPYYMRLYIYTTVIEYGNQEDFDYMFEKWLGEGFSLEKERMFTALCFTNSRNNSDRAWKSFIDRLPNENVHAVAFKCSKKLSRHSLLMDFLSDRKDLTKSIYEADEDGLGNLLALTLRHTNDLDDLEQFDEILKPFGKLTNKVRGSLFAMNSKVRWTTNVGPQFIGNVTETIDVIKRMQSVI